jgi:hypothetical protein
MAGRHKRRIAALFACLVLLGTVTTPVLATPGGNEANAARCANGGYRNYTDADGNVFRNAGQCTRYAAQGHDLVLVAPFLSADHVQNGARFLTTVTGAGLASFAPVTATATLVIGGETRGPTPVGTASITGEFNGGPYSTACEDFATIVFASVDETGHIIEDSDPTPC